MKTIEWIIGFIPKSVRALFAVLLIAISTLSGVIIHLNNRVTNISFEKEKVIYDLTVRYEHQRDSLTGVIFEIKDQSKKEILQNLENTIKEQKEQIYVQKNAIKNKRR